MPGMGPGIQPRPSQATTPDYERYRGLYDHFLNVMIKTWNYAKRYALGSDRELLNIVTGLGGETGEVLDVIKKHYCHTDRASEPGTYAKFRTKLVYELGDVLYYWLMVLHFFDISIEEVVAGNKEKLCSRHPELGQVTERFGATAIK
jgi:NTP pyrophosphatase (non-canonical NTP hydrolase)